MPEDRELVRITVVLPSPRKGKGLFARVDIPKDTLVANMRDCARMKRTEVDDYLEEYPNLPHDFVIYKPRSSLCFYDTSWHGTGRVPLWYRLNHSSRPNCAPMILNPDAPPREQVMGWVSLKNIKAGEELMFCYEDAPNEWV
jgi:SET domain-containing protein